MVLFSQLLLFTFVFPQKYQKFSKISKIEIEKILKIKIEKISKIKIEKNSNIEFKKKKVYKCHFETAKVSIFLTFTFTFPARDFSPPTGGLVR